MPKGAKLFRLKFQQMSPEEGHSEQQLKRESKDEDNTENNINSFNMSSQKSRVPDFYFQFYFNLDLEFICYLSFKSPLVKHPF